MADKLSHQQRIRLVSQSSPSLLINSIFKKAFQTPYAPETILLTVILLRRLMMDPKIFLRFYSMNKTRCVRLYIFWNHLSHETIYIQKQAKMLHRPRWYHASFPDLRIRFFLLIPVTHVLSNDSLKIYIVKFGAAHSIAGKTKYY